MNVGSVKFSIVGDVHHLPVVHEDVTRLCLDDDHSYLILIIRLIFVEVESVAFLEHLVDVVGHSVFTLLIERQQVSVVVQCRQEFAVTGNTATLDAEPLLCVLQFADKSVVVRELFRIAPYQQHGAQDGTRLGRYDGDADWYIAHRSLYSGVS